MENYWTSNKTINGLRHFVLVNGTKEKGNTIFLMVSVLDSEINLRDNAGLADIAPTLLQLLNLPNPKEMTGKSLIQEIELKGYNRIVQHV